MEHINFEHFFQKNPTTFAYPLNSTPWQAKVGEITWYGTQWGTAYYVGFAYGKLENNIALHLALGVVPTKEQLRNVVAQLIAIEKEDKDRQTVAELMVDFLPYLE